MHPTSVHERALREREANKHTGRVEKMEMEEASWRFIAELRILEEREFRNLVGYIYERHRLFISTR